MTPQNLRAPRVFLALSQNERREQRSPALEEHKQGVQNRAIKNTQTSGPSFASKQPLAENLNKKKLVQECQAKSLTQHDPVDIPKYSIKTYSPLDFFPKQHPHAQQASALFELARNTGDGRSFRAAAEFCSTYPMPRKGSDPFTICSGDVLYPSYEDPLPCHLHPNKRGSLLFTSLHTSMVPCSV